MKVGLIQMQTEEFIKKIEVLKPYYGRIVFCLLLIIFIPLLGIVCSIITLIYSLSVTRNIIKKEETLTKQLEIYSNNGFIEFNVYFVKATNYRKKDDILNKNNCILRFEDEKFFIIQDNKKIENNINSLYKFRFWEYKNHDYFAITMKSHNEYMFGLNDKTTEHLLIRLANKFKIEVE